MAKVRVYNLGNLNLKVSPLLLKDGDLIRSVNVETYPIGAKRKRPGYGTYQAGTMPNGSSIQSLANWTLNNGTQFYNYALAGGNLYYSTQGTGAWAICGNGTLSPTGTLTSAVLENTLVIGDGVSATRHSTNGTSFTNTTSAPIAVSLQEYHQRIFAAGTSSNLFWSTTGTATDWVSDSSSVLIPNAGKLTSIFKNGAKTGDALIASKNSGLMYSYDEFTLYDLSTNLGPTSSSSIGAVENTNFYLNNFGFYGFTGDSPQLLSNPIERQIYNANGSGVIGTQFSAAPGVGHGYRYYCTLGTVTDDLTDQTIGGAIAVYDFQQNEWWDYQFNNTPTAWLSFTDASGNKQLIFGDKTGQTYQFGGTNTSDNGATIQSVMEGVITYAAPESDKDWRYMWATANPGCEGRLQVALGDTFTKNKENWIDLGDLRNGIIEYRFPAGSRSKLLFWRFVEASANKRFDLYGFSIEAAVRNIQ